MLLNEVLGCPKWVPLSRVVGIVEPSQFLIKSLYKMNNGLYLCLSRYGGKHLEQTPGGPFVTGVAWAAGDGAVRRATNMDIESDDGRVSDVPPEFLPNGSRPMYGSILDSLKKTKPKVCQEKAEYRIGTDGAFVHRIIETENAIFLFRRSEHDDQEPPYAVIQKLR